MLAHYYFLAKLEITQKICEFTVRIWYFLNYQVFTDWLELKCVQIRTSNSHKRSVLTCEKSCNIAVTNRKPARKIVWHKFSKPNSNTHITYITMKTLYNTLKAASLVLAISLIAGSFTNLSALEAPSNDIDIDVSYEEGMELENWMTSLTEWEVKRLESDLNIQFEEETQVEDWMLSASNTNWMNSSVVEEEPEVELENWMTNLSEW